MSAERGWIGEPPSTMEQMREQWIAHHREQGHEPDAAPTRENPERWECKCDPDAVWTAVWRILTPEQIRMKFAHLKHRPRSTNPDHLVPGVASPTNVPPLRISDRYAYPAARPSAPRPGGLDGE
ncbi:Mycobacterium rhizamassiliense ORFan [Mycobacterium rhizamassiliense]|uniref:Mycobacterium rhizamassiliense ORFan n=1 Tax=Mycobacterium rhizamassiliense TaxID=1841860 RepID=A0A2U3NLP9_9MYCO|nr:hypothetical protein [Mycobacterium rhizamassiliense]SPM32354.1 Mycobacterium rhizamassiliense ORFan [Mycobacterium rhizamassiliense]